MMSFNNLSASSRVKVLTDFHHVPVTSLSGLILHWVHAQCGHRLRQEKKNKKKKPKSSAAVCFCETRDGLDLSSDSIISRKIAHVYLLRSLSAGIRNADGEHLGVTNHWIHRHYHHYRPRDAATQAGWLAGWPQINLQKMITEKMS